MDNASSAVCGGAACCCCCCWGVGNNDWPNVDPNDGAPVAAAGLPKLDPNEPNPPAREDVFVWLVPNPLKSGADDAAVFWAPNADVFPKLPKPDAVIIAHI